MPEFLTNYFSGLANGLLSTLKTPDAYLNKIALSAVILVVGLIVYIVFTNLIMRNIKEFKKRDKLRKVWKQTIVTLMAISVLFIWVQAMNVLILLSLLFGVFIVFMVRGLTNNIIGYFVIKYRDYVEVGHRIEINGFIGDVIDINPINIKLLEVRNGLSSDANTGRIIKLPNKIIFDESIKIIGGTNTFVWQEIKYILAFDSDWHAAEKIMTDVGNLYSNESIELKVKEITDPFTSEKVNSQPVFSVDTNADGIILILRYVVDYREGTHVKTELQRKILTQFSENAQIKFATLDVRIFPE